MANLSHRRRQEQIGIVLHDGNLTRSGSRSTGYHVTGTGRSRFSQHPEVQRSGSKNNTAKSKKTCEHIDINRRSEVLPEGWNLSGVIRDGKPWLMDFGASFVIRGWLASIRSNLRRIVRKYDERDVAVRKYRVAPDLLSTSDRETISHQLPFQGLMALGRKLLSGDVSRVFENRLVDCQSQVAESHTIECPPRGVCRCELIQR